MNPWEAETYPPPMRKPEGSVLSLPAHLRSCQARDLDSPRLGISCQKSQEGVRVGVSAGARALWGCDDPTPFSEPCFQLS